MSEKSDIRRRRKLKRNIGVARVTYQQQMDHIAVKTMKRIITAVGWEHVKFSQDTSFSLETEIASDRAGVVEQILLEEGYLKTHNGDFIHKKMRLSDFVSIGGMVSIVPKVDMRVLQESLVDLCKQPPCFSWPKVTDEEVKAVEERLSAPHGL